MPTTEQNFHISQREFESEACVDLSQRNKPSDSLQRTLPFTIYSILAVTLFQPRPIDFSDCVHFRLGIALQREKRIVAELATAE